ncbi:MAG: lytic transglycosylase domain-containing protein, partial [Bacteroidales bacterium]|nr:lytic transglycosylase domain-containing protein [Bacteroidales bacterium]
DEIGDIDFQNSFQKEYSVFALNLPDDISFAHEKVPMDYFDVREAFDQELLINTYWQSQTLLFIKRANRYFPIIEKILAENNVPDDFKYLVLAESDLKNRISPSGAVGIWQLLKSTARDYDLVVNSEVDERYNMEKSTEAACKYLNHAYELFGSWNMAAASYNMGRNGLLKQVKRQKQDNYYNLLLNNETARYLYRILAIKVIIENPEKYGFHLREKDLYQTIPCYKVKIDSSVENFVDFAEKYDINYKILKYFNPWLRESFLKNPSQKEYFIKIPIKGFRNYKTIYDLEK